MGRHSDDDGNEIADYAEAHPYQDPAVAALADPPDPDAVNGVVDDGSEPHPLRPGGGPMRYRRDARRDDPSAIAAETSHVIAHLSTVAAEDDDPETNADDVTVTVVDHVDGDPALCSIIGELDAEPAAPYLRADFDPGDPDQVTFTRYSEDGRE